MQHKLTFAERNDLIGQLDNLLSGNGTTGLRESGMLALSSAADDAGDPTALHAFAAACRRAAELADQLATASAE